MRISLVVLATVFFASSVAQATSIDREVLRRVFIRANPSVATCGLEPGRYVVRVVIEAEGRVSNVSLVEPFDLPAERARCVTAAYRRLIFPRWSMLGSTSAQRPAEPRSHLPPPSRAGANHIIVTWPFMVP